MITYYAGFEDGTTTFEIEKMVTDRYTIIVPIHEDCDGNNDLLEEVEVEIISPVSYTLSDNDHARIDELLCDEG